MKNVHILAKLRRLIKTLAVSFFFIGVGILGSAFKSSETNDNDNNRPGKDSLSSNKYGFKNLFSNNTFDPTKPYVTQLNPLAVPFVQKYIKAYGAKMERLKIWGKPYLDMYDGILTKYGLPTELKYLSIIESDLKAGAVSVAGAVGPWQIMSFEAKRMGLKMNSRGDERTNYYKSTHAAARILKELYARFDDWLLVVAAYNAGSGRVNQAIKKSGSRNFWVLQNYLPLETRNHVKKFISTHYIFEGNGGLTTLTAAETATLKSSLLKGNEKVSPTENAAFGTLEVSGRYNSFIVAKNLGIDANQFNKLNPNFDKLITSGTPYQMRLPIEKIKLFEEKKEIIMSETIQSLLGTAAKATL